MDPLSVVCDEVALEGLDGVTVPSLWIRLRTRSPRFPLQLDALTQAFIWRSLVSNAELDFYELPREREDVVMFDRFAEVNPDTGIQTTDRFFDGSNDIYPIMVVMNDKRGIQGSCAHFKERRNVTKHVRSPELKPLVSLEEAVNRYGRKLVLVASQKQRFHILIGDDSDPDLKIPDPSYCILERLGRARWQGELQRDLHSSSFRMDAGKFHYLRRCLVRHDLITMQSYVIRLRSKYDIMMETLSKTLQETPGQTASLRAKERTFKHVYHYMLSYKMVQLVTLPLEEVLPGAGPCITKKGTKVTVRCLKLLKPYMKKDLLGDEDEEEDAMIRYDQTMERDLFSQAYYVVLSTGTKGISQTGLRLRMNLTKLDVRMLCRRLEKAGLIKVLRGQRPHAAVCEGTGAQKTAVLF
ncbi:hypothetical protein CRUP_018928 [Coryphaenoides rupestris]|nr:hypothetical protein CRUP_018928 [Coryphaenoides rupestris]